jgi:carbamoyltransferase
MTKLIAMHNGHDASITAMEDGEVLFHWELERVLNLKHFCGLDVPYIFDVLETHALPRLGWTVDDIDVLVLGGQSEWAGTELNTIIPTTGYSDTGLEYSLYENDYDEPYADFVAEWRGKERRFIVVTHHVSHMAYAYYTSPYNESLVMAYDGVGDFLTTTTFGIGKDGRLDYIANLTKDDGKDFPNNSIGLTYSFLGSLFLFFHTPYILSTAGKAMGLSSYGTPYPEDHDVWQACWELLTTYPQDRELRYFLHKVNKYIEPEELCNPMSENVQNLMATIQEVAEVYVCRLVGWMQTKHGTHNYNLCMAGGCALNVQINTRLLDEKLVKNLYVPPATSDCGISYGAILYAWHHVMGKPWSPVGFHDPYKGDEVYYQLPNREHEDFGWSREAFKSEWPKLDAHYIDEEDTLIWLAANWLAEGKLIAWAQGRAEIGPRALGNRSILCHPGLAGKQLDIEYHELHNGGVATLGTMKDTINAKVKNREFWRPFAPICLEEYAEHIFEIDHAQPYMLEAPKVRNWHGFQADGKYWWRDMAAVVHVDGTGRVQTVNAGQNRLLFRLLDKFHEITRIPVILNTSLNDAGLPIANSLQSILHLLEDSELDYAVVGNWVFSKK